MLGSYGNHATRNVRGLGGSHMESFSGRRGRPAPEHFRLRGIRRSSDAGV
jgi:hypothetical protein